MPTARQLIVNADDLGLSSGVNAGIVEAHARGIVTSTSLMVRQPAAREAARMVLAHPALSVGLHLDLGEWVYRDGAWRAVYEVAALDDAAAVRAELRRQLDAFHALLGRAPTHLDSHQHVHRTEPVRTAVCAAARRLGIPVRHCTSPIRYCGAFYGQTGKGAPYPAGITAEHLCRTLAALAPGVTELGCHPGFGHGLTSPYRAERERELEVLCGPRVRAALRAADIRLRAFGAVPPAPPD